MSDEQSDQRRQLARRVAKEAGITEEQALELIATIGGNLPSLLFEGRALKRAADKNA
jgi:hypothetical protein